MKSQNSLPNNLTEHKKISSLRMPVRQAAESFSLDNLTYDECTSDEAFSIELIRNSIVKAHHLNAHTFYIEAEQDLIRIRFRIQNTLTEELIGKNPGFDYAPFFNLTGMGSYEQSQEMQMLISIKGQEYALRCMPLLSLSSHNSLTVKLDKSARFAPTLDELLIPSTLLRSLRQALVENSGLILFCGTDPHELTLTRLAALQHLNTPDRKIVSIENALRPRIPRISYLSAPRSESAIASYIHSLMSHEADIIGFDINHSRTVLENLLTNTGRPSTIIGTLQSNSAIDGLAFLMRNSNLQAKLSRSLTAVLMQHELLNTCSNCMVVHHPTEKELIWIQHNFPGYDQSKLNFTRGEGCDMCNGTGVSGVCRVYEFMHIDQEMREALLRWDITAVASVLASQNYFEPAKHVAFRYAQQQRISLSQAMMID